MVSFAKHLELTVNIGLDVKHTVSEANELNIKDFHPEALMEQETAT